MQATRGTPIAGESSPSIPAKGRMRLLFGVVALLGLVLDAVTKNLAVHFLDPEDPPRLLGGLVTLQLIRNPGAAFSLGENYTFVFAILAILVLCFILIWLMPKIRHRGWACALGLLVAGVGGNAIDRMFRAPGFLHGHVVDFVQLPHFAIFNVADMCITSAAILIVFLSLIKNIGIDGQRYVAAAKKVAAKESSADPGTRIVSPAGDNGEPGEDDHEIGSRTTKEAQPE